MIDTFEIFFAAQLNYRYSRELSQIFSKVSISVARLSSAISDSKQSDFYT